MKFPDETLMAYADGELDAATRADIEAAAAEDPAIAAAVERHRALAARVRTAYAGVAAEPVPDRLAALSRAPVAAPAADLAARRAGRNTAAMRWRAPQWAALAASIAIALFVGLLLVREPALYQRVDGRLVARAALDEALTTELASQPSGSGVAIGISFKDRSGAWCRTFHLRDDTPVAGLACRSGADWELRVLAEAPAAGGEVRTAAAMPLAVLQAVDAAIDGEPLDAAAETAARDASWRNASNVAE